MKFPLLFYQGQKGMDTNTSTRIEALLSNEPFKRYIKAIISRVSVKILDPISLAETEVILSGDPAKEEPGCILDLWTPMEVVYFERNNRQILAEGLLVDYVKSVQPVPTVNNVTDADIDAVLNDKFFSLKNLLKQFTSPAPVLRVLERAKALNKPVKTIEAITARLSELQAEEYEGLN